MNLEYSGVDRSEYSEAELAPNQQLRHDTHQGTTQVAHRGVLSETHEEGQSASHSIQSMLIGIKNCTCALPAKYLTSLIFKG